MTTSNSTFDLTKITSDVLVLNQKCAHTLSFYEIKTGKALHHIRLPNYPHEFAVDNDENFAFVGHYGVLGSDCIGEEGGSSVFVIDIKQGKWVHTLSTWPYHRIHGVGVDAQNRLFAMGELDSVLLRFSQPLKQVQPDLAVASGGYKTHLFALTKEGDTAFSVNLLSNTVCKIHPNDPTIAPVCIMTGKKPEGNCLSLDEKTLYITNRDDNTIVAIDTKTMTIIKTASTGIDPNRVYRAPDGNLLVINYGDKFVSKFSPELEELGKIYTDNVPIAISFHPNSEYAFLSLKGDHIGVVELAKNAVIRQFPTLQEPDVSYVLTPQK